MSNAIPRTSRMPDHAAMSCRAPVARANKAVRIAVCLLIVMVGAARAEPVRAADRPNIVLFLADDAGYADFGFHGSETFETPALDSLARDGVVFLDAYAASPVCSPSRAGLLTGRFPSRFGVEFNLTHDRRSGAHPSEPGLPVSERTLADWLADAGYATTLIGKWHLGVSAGYHPLDRGFQHFF